MTLSQDTLQALHEAATPGPWMGYSEPDVGLPYSLFAGSPMVSGFGPVEPMTGADVDLVALLRNAVPEILTLIAERDAMREALSFWAKRRTCEEALLGPSEFAEASVERRVEMLGERKRQHDEAVLLARDLTALGGNHHGS